MPYNLVCGTDGLRPLNCEERETLMGYSLDYTAPCLPRAAQKGDQQRYDNERKTLLGESVQCHVVAYLEGSLLFVEGDLSEPPDAIIGFTGALCNWSDTRERRAAVAAKLEACVERLTMRENRRTEVSGLGECFGLSMGKSRVPYVSDNLQSCGTAISDVCKVLRTVTWDWFRFTTLQVNAVGSKATLHRDKGNVGASLIISFGACEGGRLLLHLGHVAAAVDVFGNPLMMDGSLEHETEDYSGTRGSIVAFVHSAFSQMSALQRVELLQAGFPIPASDGCDITGAAYPCWRPQQLKPRTNDYLSSLTLEFGRHVSHRGGEIKGDIGAGSYPDQWPLVAGKMHWFTWHVALSFRQSGAHINILELRAALASIKWVIRNRNITSRNLILYIDSQVCFCAIAKGRSSSRPLNLVLQRFNALLVAADIALTVVYVRSSRNPADRPSRWVTSGQL